VVESSGPDPCRLTVLLGLCDEPERQCQSPLRIDLSVDGTCVVLGVPGSGKTTLLRQIALDVAQGHGAGDVHLYGLDAGDGSLAPLAALTHCGDVVGVDDLDRTIRLLGRLGQMAEERRKLLSESGAGDWARYRQSAGPPGGTPGMTGTPGSGAWVVLLVDDYPAFMEISDSYQHGALGYQLASLIRAGPAVGIHAVVVANARGDFTSTTFGLFGRRILLRQAERADYDLVQLPRDLHPVAPPPGRAYINGAVARELQVIWPQGSDDSYPPEAQAVALIAATRDLPPEACPRPVPAFPSEVTLAALTTLRPAGAGEAVIGIGGPELEPLSLDLDRCGPHLLIAGRDRSGRSNALRTCLEVISAVERRTRFLILAPRPSPLRELAADPRVTAVAVTAEKVTESLREFDGSTGLRSLVLLADDCESLTPEAAGPLEAILRRARESGLRALLAGRTDDLLRTYDGWLRYLRSLSCGLLLAPEAHDGDLFDLRLPPIPVARMPGRGYLIRGREVLTVQIALASVQPPDRGPKAGVRTLTAPAWGQERGAQAAR
jgi:S-DNA-T family DNA segregation ATPase FtsK/SpoIIIE